MERLGQALAGGAHPRRNKMFESLPAKTKIQIPQWVSA